MSLGNLIGQILQQGMSGQGQSRLEHSVGPAGLGGIAELGDLLGPLLGGKTASAGTTGHAGLGQVLGSVLGGQAAGRGASGNLGDLLGGLLGGGQGSAGGLGDLLDSMLGGSARSKGSSPQSAGGGAGMAILATLAMAALKNWQGQKVPAMGFAAASADEGSFAITAAEAAQFSALDSEQLEQLMLRAMISAAKADGVIDNDEMQRIVGRIAADGITAAEKEFLLNELRQPLDLPALIAAVPNQAVGAQVYAASLLAIELDDEAEFAYLEQLARGLQLESATVARLHQLTATPQR